MAVQMARLLELKDSPQTPGGFHWASVSFGYLGHPRGSRYTAHHDGTLAQPRKSTETPMESEGKPKTSYLSYNNLGAPGINF